MRADVAQSGRVVHGCIGVYFGSIVLAEISLTLKIGSTQASETTLQPTKTFRRYRKIFASYSHDDRAIVDEFFEYARAIGDRYLADVADLRSGERWQPALQHLIHDADVFQLFWSWNSLASPYVRNEWEYAVALQRPAFIRPVYWDDPLPSRGGLPPQALRQFHFQRIRRPAALVASTRRADDGRPPTDFTALRLDTSVSRMPPRRTSPDAVKRVRQEKIAKRLAQVHDSLVAGAIEEALSACEQILLLDPDDSEALDLLNRARAALDERQIRAFIAEGRLLLARGEVASGARARVFCSFVGPDLRGCAFTEARHRKRGCALARAGARPGRTRES
jgi:hypothetical protein